MHMYNMPYHHKYNTYTANTQFKKSSIANIPFFIIIIIIIIIIL